MNNLLWCPGDGQPHGGVNGEGGDDPVSHRVRGVHCEDAGVAPSALAIMVRGGWWGVWGCGGGKSATQHEGNSQARSKRTKGQQQQQQNVHSSATVH